MNYLKCIDLNFKLQAYPDVRNKIKYILNRKQYNTKVKYVKGDTKAIEVDIKIIYSNGYYPNAIVELIIVKCLIKKYMIKVNGELLLHRDDGPARIKRNSKGVIIRELWYNNDKLHRIDGPAYIERNDEGVVIRKFWYQTNIYYRINNLND